LAADATSAKGRVTVDAQTVRVPVFSPADVAARGEIHLSDVVIGAGPLADQLINTVTQVRAILKPGSAADGRDLKTWLQMSQQTIPVTIQNQRVFHENLKFTHKDMTIKTRGSVGFDQSLNLVAEIPIADDWIAGKSYLAGLRGQSISIPIGGTVSKPQLDKQAIQQLSTQLVKQAAGNAINQAIGDKITPKVNEYQNQINNKLNNELNKFQGKIGEKLGGSLFPQGSAPPPANNGAAPVNGTSQPDLGQQLEGELLKGIGNLFGGGK
jgi:translocation and assembly module TamB